MPKFAIIHKKRDIILTSQGSLFEIGKPESRFEVLNNNNDFYICHLDTFSIQNHWIIPFEYGRPLNYYLSDYVYDNDTAEWLDCFQDKFIGFYDEYENISQDSIS